MKRKRFQCFGQVQGVGFRWRARHAARLYGCTGWVRNEDDGSVTLELQGDPEAIRRVMMSLEQGAFIQIERTVETPLLLDPEERGFETRYN